MCSSNWHYSMLDLPLCSILTLLPAYDCTASSSPIPTAHLCHPRIFVSNALDIAKQVSLHLGLADSFLTPPLPQVTTTSSAPKSIVICLNKLKQPCSSTDNDTDADTGDPNPCPPKAPTLPGVSGWPHPQTMTQMQTQETQIHVHQRPQPSQVCQVDLIHMHVLLLHHPYQCWKRKLQPTPATVTTQKVQQKTSRHPHWGAAIISVSFSMPLRCILGQDKVPLANPVLV